MLSVNENVKICRFKNIPAENHFILQYVNKQTLVLHEVQFILLLVQVEI